MVLIGQILLARNHHRHFFLCSEVNLLALVPQIKASFNSAASSRVLFPQEKGGVISIYQDPTGLHFLHDIVDVSEKEGGASG